jgi:hypothetical protein
VIIFPKLWARVKSGFSRRNGSRSAREPVGARGNTRYWQGNS